jgi:hypothetical protein
VSLALAGCATGKAMHGAGGKAKFALRVNAGTTESYTDKAGNVWQGEKEYVKGGGFGFVGGQSVDRGKDTKIEATADARIYQTEHYAMTGFKAEVPQGKHTVRLHFAETNPKMSKTPGGRVFDVAIQGKVVLPGFEVLKDAGAGYKALVKEFKGIEVGNGALDIGFVAKAQNPEINGIEILGE